MIKRFLKQYHRSLYFKGTKTMYKGKILFNKFVFINSKISDDLYMYKIIESNSRMGFITFVL